MLRAASCTPSTKMRTARAEDRPRNVSGAEARYAGRVRSRGSDHAGAEFDHRSRTVGVRIGARDGERRHRHADVHPPARHTHRCTRHGEKRARMAWRVRAPCEPWRLHWCVASALSTRSSGVVVEPTVTWTTSVGLKPICKLSDDGPLPKSTSGTSVMRPSTQRCAPLPPIEPKAQSHGELAAPTRQHTP
jgi:hypothetical protein